MNNKIQEIQNNIKKIIDHQDMIIGRQLREIEDYQDTQMRYKQVLYKRKQEAGYNQEVSFDIIWEEVLEKAKKYDEITKK
ncbi:MAG: hypothetical protein ACOCVF_00100 [bacterium]